MAKVILKDIKKVYPNTEKKKKAKKGEPEKKVNLQITDEGVVAVQEFLRRIRFHDLRHSCANLLISARVPLIEVQQWLGHSSLSTTADLYSHLEYAAKEQNARVISQMLL